MFIEELVKKHFDRWVTDTEFGNVEVHLRAALTEQAETHAVELRAYETTVANLEQRIRELEETVAEYDRRIVAEAMRAALTELAAEHDRKQALLLEAHCERVSSLQERIRELEALMVPGGFPSDVMTAAGLVYHGKRDKVLAERLSIGAQSMIAAAHALKGGE